MFKLPELKAAEKLPFGILAVLLLFNGIVLECNEVVATSGFVSKVGAPHILWLWGIDMAIILLTSSLYSLFVDRMKRTRLAVFVFAGFSITYVLLYALFETNAPDWLTYSLLTVITDQQWLLVPLLIWAMGNDLFSISVTRRLFPALAAFGMAGAIAGNGLAAAAGSLLGESVSLLLLNAGLLLVGAVILGVAMSRVTVNVRQAREAKEGYGLSETLREGWDFIKNVRAFKYLAIAMILAGAAFNVVEFHFIATAGRQFTDGVALQAFYGSYKVVVILSVILVQVFITRRLAEKTSTVFAAMPAMLLMGMISAILLFSVWPLVGVVIGNYLARLALFGVDERARQSFQGLVPDERRGRVAAFMDGYLYPVGAIVSCIILGLILFAQAQLGITLRAAEFLYLILAAVTSLASLLIIWFKYRPSYDSSMLNWRLKRRKVTNQDILNRLDF
jgi:hypothetical protein